jgi:hypothetical protein
MGRSAMALLAAPLSAAAEELWLGALAGSSLRFDLLTAPDGSRAGLDRGLEDLLRTADLVGTQWVARFDGTPDDLAYARDVVGLGDTPDEEGEVATVLLGRGPALATAAAVDASAGGSRHRLLLLQVDEQRCVSAQAALASGDATGALRMARLAVLRDAHRAWAVVAVSPGAERVLRRVAAPVAPTRLPATSSAHHARLPLRAPELSPAVLGLRRRVRVRMSALPRPPGRLGAVAASLLIATIAAASATWVLARHQSQVADLPGQRLVQPPSAFPAAPLPRTGAMTATWDRTAQIVFFGGATVVGSGHGQPFDDTWRGALPPAGPWQRVTPEVLQPTARLAGAMAADVTDGYVLLFGGEAAGDQGLQDTWTYGGGWAQSSPRTSPPAGQALAATEPSTGRVLLVTTCCALAAVPTGERMQTWRWTGGDWSFLGPAPGWVTTAALVSDPWDGTVVMVADGGEQKAATFTWDGTAWSSVARATNEPPITPGTRPALAYDPGDHAVLDVVTDDQGAHHTWMFTSAHGWSEVPDAGGPPVVGQVLSEPVDGRAMLYGGLDADGEFTQRWFWTSGTWTESLQPPPVAALPAAGFGEAIGADPRMDGLVMFGGSNTTDQTWVSSGSSWSQEFFSVPFPDARLGASMVYDPESLTTLLVGGRLDDGSLAADMWEWDGTEWSRLPVSAVPPPTVQAPMAWDSVHRQAVLLVPDNSGPLPQAATWTWDEGADAWALQRPATSPPLRAESSMTFDPATGEVLLTVPCCPGATEQTTETWTWDGATWARRQTLHQPPIHAAVTSDSLHGRTLLVAACCGGFDAASTVGPPQTWTWDGHDWTQLTAARLPALQDVAAVVTSARGEPMLVARVAGAGPRHPLDGLWSWTGAAWVRLV